MLGSRAAGAQGSSTPQGVETARRTRLLAAARENRGRGSAVAGASSPDPPSHRRVGWKGSGDARARGDALALRLTETAGSLQALTLADGGGDTGAAGSHRIQDRTPPLSSSPRRRRKTPGPWRREWHKVLRRTQAASSVCAAGISATPAGDPTGTGEDGRGG